MRRATLLFNPLSGRANPETIERVSSVLRDRGIDVTRLSLDHPHLTLNLVRPPGTIALPAWFALSWARLHRINPYTQTISTDTFTCGPGLTSPIRVQADGEFLGHTPVTVTLIPKALRILLPSSVS
jgi:diacylglycerol kinase family enzyme